MRRVILVDNQKGFTLIELLISISVGSIVIALLMSILSSTLITKNHIEYTNRLDNEVYQINQILNESLRNLGYKSVRDFTNIINTVPNENDEFYEVLLFTEEFEPEFEGVNIRISKIFNNQSVLIYSVHDQSLYYGPLAVATEETIYDDALTADRVNEFINNRSQYRLSDTNTIILEGSSIRDVYCIQMDERNHYSLCSAAFLNLDLILQYKLNNGNTLRPKEYRSSIFY